jgi:hypothetical protein
MEFSMPEIRLKSVAEIQKRLRDLIHRHKKKFLKRNTEPCLGNCKGALSIVNPELASHLDYNEDRCTFCKSKDPDSCNNHSQFQARYTREELIEGFKEELKNPEILTREYRDIAIMLWVLNMFPEGDD